MSAVRITLAGHVQGVGFRPFVYRLAHEHGLLGSVQNRLGEVEVIAIGRASDLMQFQRDVVEKAPPLSRPTVTGIESIDVPSANRFEIIESSARADAKIFVPPDYFMCDDCGDELHDPDDRRFNYPFINCTQCGPRYTLIEALPYDRANTSMAGFPLCADCEREYRDPADRRFHAEPVACPTCGPQLTFETQGKAGSNDTKEALDAAVDAIRSGCIVAVKGIGGYHLMCDACDPAAVGRLRRRKQRPDKPLAVMFPVEGSDGLDFVRRCVTLQDVEATLATGPIRPIVLAARKPDSALADNVAPGLTEIGVFLPYSPLHQLLLDQFGGPVVATSGNISGEPVLTDNIESATRLKKIADCFLQHDRPIVRPADDPVYRRIAGRMRPLRTGRGSAPRELALPWPQKQALLAVGGHMKGTVALSWDRRVVVSPHIGEMDSPRSLAVFEQVAADLQSLYGIRATRLVCDAHPGYTTHRWAHNQRALPVERVWHHQAHASAVAAEVDRPGQWLMFAWDGVGLGEDQTLWGGEALLGKAGNWRRVASLRTFRLPGGERAGRAPWRSAAALHWECDSSWPDCPDRDGLAETAWRNRINCPETSAAGRLFDAAAALVCDLPVTSFEAQGPMILEALCHAPARAIELPIYKDGSGLLRSDWQPLLAVLTDQSLDRAARAEIFHSSIATIILRQAESVRERHSVDHVGLCGGVFQNRVLTEQALGLLRQAGFDVYLAEQLPCNDAALSFGQAAEIGARNAA
ncbi:MAG: carbamoyltransferase HypF [Gammaproteobacteria bacterium]|nr:carbamoyltransferase HypF [Gammaproteobacteria bacterium]MBT8110180.1 carbamoyltransferase HypF [Gammaproteobacteria bacterium]NND47339.1 carbamoyltransferase HypF [Woeseiaceae bacterium]NNL44883.1 carbamoyltransferase HypF [Woeseiaceae bacterium]